MRSSKVFPALGSFIVALSALLGATPTTGRTDSIPPCVIHAGISSEHFQPGRTNATARIEANVSLYWSNGWWEVFVEYPHPQHLHPKLESCMRIPDGTRRYVLFAGSSGPALSSAEACPIAFPMPGAGLTFWTWLSLCPGPELPFIDAERMRRFPNAPTCRTFLLNHPRNEGAYAAKYLQPQGLFLSELTVWNNGFYLGISGTAEDEVTPYHEPFENGFKELHYEVRQTTNVHGVRFPLRSIASVFAPKPDGRSSNDVYAIYVRQISVRQISFAPRDFAKRPSAPGRLRARDLRPPHLPESGPLVYVVSNDWWNAVSDSELFRRARVRRPESADDRHDIAPGTVNAATP